MKLKNILLMVLSALILSTCAVVDPPGKLTEWRESRSYGPTVVHNYNDAFLHSDASSSQNTR